MDGDDPLQESTEAKQQTRRLRDRAGDRLTGRILLLGGLLLVFFIGLVAVSYL